MDPVELQLVARNADALIARGREQLVSGVRAASASDMTERQIAALMGRSQKLSELQLRKSLQMWKFRSVAGSIATATASQSARPPDRRAADLRAKMAATQRSHGWPKAVRDAGTLPRECSRVTDAAPERAAPTG